MNFDIKKLLPHIIAVLAFVAIALTYFSPVLEGKELRQGDITNFAGMSKEIADFREANHEEPLWTNSMFGGMPAFQISTLYKGNLMTYVDKTLRLGLPRPASYVLLYMLGFYVLMLSLGVNAWISLIGSVGFAFSSYFFIILEAGHNSKAHAIGYMAPVLAGFILTYKGKQWLGLGLTALAFALELNTNHLQITYYLGLVLLITGIFYLVDAIKNNQLAPFIKRSVLLVVALVLALSTNVSNLWSTYEYSKVTIRGKSELTLGKEDNQTSGLDKDYATAWSYGMGETFTLLVPNFKGGASEPVATDEKLLKEVSPQNKQIMAYAYKYHGDQPFTSGPVYIGAVIIFLFILGVFLLNNNLKWIMLTATILSIVLAWGKNFMGVTEFFLDYFPGYNKFRAVSMILVIAELAIPVLGFYALDQLIKNRAEIMTNIKKFYMSVGVAGGLALLMLLVPTMFTDFDNAMADGQLSQQLTQAGFSGPQLNLFLSELEGVRESMFRTDALRSLAFILIAAVVLFMYLKGKLKETVVLVVIGALVLIDLWGVDKRYLNNDKDRTGKYISWVNKSEVENPFPMSPADRMILQDKDPNFRVFNTAMRLDQDSRTSFYHKSLGGYHGAKLRRYQELIDYHLSRGNRSVMNMLNTKYYIVQGDDGQLNAMPNPDALGNAWYVDGYKLVASADSEITALSSFNPATTAIIDNRFESELAQLPKNGLSKGTIKLDSYKPNDLVYSSSSSSDGLVVFSEIYYDKGWNVTIDGQPADHFRANYVLRAMVVPAGDHKIEFTFEPTSYFVGEKVSLAGSLLVILMFFGMIYKEVKSTHPKKSKA